MGKVTQSAGILLYRGGGLRPLEVLLVHPGGPFWAKKDLGAWSVPKGEMEEGEELLAAAVREFTEETGVAVEGEFLALRPVRYASGKVVHAWAVHMDLDPAQVRSNEFLLEWPPGSGRRLMVPEVDRAQWFGVAEAREKILPAQAPLLEDLEEKLQHMAPGQPSSPAPVVHQSPKETS